MSRVSLVFDRHLHFVRLGRMDRFRSVYAGYESGGDLGHHPHHPRYGPSDSDAYDAHQLQPHHYTPQYSNEDHHDVYMDDVDELLNEIGTIYRM